MAAHLFGCTTLLLLQLTKSECSGEATQTEAASPEHSLVTYARIRLTLVNFHAYARHPALRNYIQLHCLHFGGLQDIYLLTIYYSPYVIQIDDSQFIRKIYRLQSVSGYTFVYHGTSYQHMSLVLCFNYTVGFQNLNL